MTAHVARVLLAIVLEHDPCDLVGGAIPDLVRVTTCGSNIEDHYTNMEGMGIKEGGEEKTCTT